MSTARLHTNASISGQPTLTVLTHRPDAPWCVYCLPPGGFGAEFYLPWCSLLPPTIELCAVQLPGRGPLADQPCVTNPQHLTAVLADLIHTHDDARPFALFGHSLGALLAFTTTRHLRRTHRRLPVLLAVSALPAPHLPNAYTHSFGLRLASGQAAIADLIGPPPENVRQSPDRLATLYIPLLADLLLALQYRHHDETPLNNDLALYGGDSDPITPFEHLTAWNDLVTTPTTPRLFPGGHTYLTHQTEAVITQLDHDMHTATRHTTPP